MMTFSVVFLLLFVVITLLSSVIFYYRNRACHWREAYLEYVRMVEEKQRKIEKLKVRISELEKWEGNKPANGSFFKPVGATSSSVRLELVA